MSLESDLRRIPGVYADLAAAAIPGRSGEPTSGSPDPLDRPAPGNLKVMEHRHKLVRGLRWWVDAVHPKDGRVPRVGQDVGLMCGMLLRAAPTMEPEDRTQLGHNLFVWLRRAWEFMGDAEPTAVQVPAGAWDQRVRVADAARILGCTVRTVQRRVPAAERVNGLVLLRDAAPRCGLCDLRAGECAHVVTPFIA